MRQLKINKQITNRETESLDKYFTEINKMDLISAEMEADLARRIQQGDPAALDKLTKANLRFVVSVAKQYQNRGLSLNDMINEGNIGLIKAAQRFDEKRGFKFISYAVWWIRQSIMQALSDQMRIVRLPLNRVGSLNRIYRVFSELEQQLQREPSYEEVGRAIDMPVEMVEENVLLSARHLSVDSPFQLGEDGSLLDTIPDSNAVSPDELLINESLKNEIAQALAVLTPRDSQVLTLFYGLDGNIPHTLQEVAKQMNLSAERIRQLREQATRRIKNSGRSKRLAAYLG